MSKFWHCDHKSHDFKFILMKTILGFYVIRAVKVDPPFPRPDFLIPTNQTGGSNGMEPSKWTFFDPFVHSFFSSAAGFWRWFFIFRNPLQVPRLSDAVCCRWEKGLTSQHCQVEAGKRSIVCPTNKIVTVTNWFKVQRQFKVVETKLFHMIWKMEILEQIDSEEFGFCSKSIV